MLVKRASTNEGLSPYALLSQSAAKSLIEWSPVNSRIITAWFYSKYTKLSIIHVYAPTNEACDEDKDQFYEELQSVVDRYNRHDMVIITGDINARKDGK